MLARPPALLRDGGRVEDHIEVEVPGLEGGIIQETLDYADTGSNSLSGILVAIGAGVGAKMMPTALSGIEAMRSANLDKATKAHRLKL